MRKSLTKHGGTSPVLRLRIPLELLKDLRRAADKAERTLADYVRWVLRRAAKRKRG